MENKRIYKILITGTESSGKTTLTEQLAQHFGGVFVPEYARQYLLQKPAYEQPDLIKILRGQIDLEQFIFSKTKNCCFCDTGPETIKVWSQFKFGRSHRLIDKAVLNMRYDLILLLKPDLEWEYDVLRENPDHRNELHDMFKETLQWANHKYLEVEGRGQNRLNSALWHIQKSFEKESLFSQSN